ncbi:enoyl-CoA hydratase [Mucilaginibacter terrenus]|uniref:Enoyl-CoA hydratase n=1 Tax=Mucilaginibacter terrenus TaxID=2482727 RepID=A0A3E2NPV7_9SPHI|nr:enoyl-CoA hydratase-related protein [Mucilaginibacter terrenus]RFZ83007.1 enoyl-CoA hydratase [Mucilaginibacter terrenus]
MAYENLLTEQKDRILYITINRESKLNALNRQTLQELNKAITAAIADQSVGGIIITGAGNKAFVAGADIAEFAGVDQQGGTAIAREGQSNVFDLIANSGKPIIAAVNGFALGGGLELAMACHIRIASDNAKMGLPEVTLGLIPGYGGTQRLTQLVGRGKALEMILTADMVTAEQALQSGLVNAVVPQTELLAKAEEMTAKILSRAPLALAAAIRSVNAAATDGVNGFETEITEFGQCFSTADFKEGVDAFLNKRKPLFTGK